jgi:oxidase EvaA
MLESIQNWLASLIKEAAFKAEFIPLTHSTAWSLQNGLIEHKSGGFFKVTGLKWVSPQGSLWQQPFFGQREIGTLGFLMRPDGGSRYLLLQAKIEPGNIGIIQLAPTCQATDSNARRVHGGEFPPFVDYFSPASKNLLYDVLQSEQGTRFFHKRNRNVLAMAPDNIPSSAFHQWVQVEEVLDFLKTDYLVNTDARSVLVSAPWNLLVGRRPFSRYADGFGAELMQSSAAPSRHIKLDDLKAGLIAARTKTEKPETVALEQLPGWRVTNDGVIPGSDSGYPFRVRQIKVSVRGREVPAWDQPIIDSASQGKVFLMCARSKGVLHFLFGAGAEAGLYHKIELSPTVVIEPGAAGNENIFDHPPGIVRAQCRQSEEGGRFYQDTNLFRLIDLGETYDVPQGYYWLTLWDIRRLLDQEGWFTNEARSALSLLLPWM